MLNVTDLRVVVCSGSGTETLLTDMLSQLTSITASTNGVFANGSSYASDAN